MAKKGIITANLVTRDRVDAILAAKAGMASNIVPAEAVMALRGEAAGEYGEWVTAEAAEGRTVLHAAGLSRHSAFPEGGVNAIHEAMRAALASGLLRGYDRQAVAFFTHVNDDCYGTALGIAGEDDISGRTTCVGTMTSLRGDGRLALHVNIRYHIRADENALLESMRTACEQNGCVLEAVQASRGNYFPRENPVVDALTGVFREMTGSGAEPYVMGGGTYARKLPNALGFGLGGLPREETALFAPGHGGAHQPDEGLHLASFKRALLIFAMGILEADRVLP